ncbi:MAG: di-trans,poly-cis-decaprenylcistransferase [Candidatus Pacebacteria bacterium]|nr:di-trans,poly-cis-decaprenylcistransferase [Candidatus Paceibacterota bacterium]
MQFEKLPSHLVIIPDGNRRWAKEKSLPSFLGHREGYKRVEEIVQEAKDIGISHVTVWAFSTENWKRNENEKEELFSLITQGLRLFHENILKKKSRFVHFGRKDRLGDDLRALITTLEDETKEYSTFTLSVAIDYGGEDEVVRASDALKRSGDISKTIYDFLDTKEKNIPPPDFIIRTSGEKRTSGFMPLQSLYSEWYFSEKHFPDFGIKELYEALNDYKCRERRRGK